VRKLHKEFIERFSDAPRELRRALGGVEESVIDAELCSVSLHILRWGGELLAYSLPRFSESSS
jgi:hypothetical protein